MEGAAQLAGLAVQVCRADAPAPAGGSAPLAPGQARALERALDNILSNIARDGGARHAAAPLRCDWRVQDGQWLAQLHTPRLATAWPRRPFEPLKNPLGSGMGLYQARRSLREAGGDLHADETPGGVVFALRLALAEAECQKI